MNNSKWLSGISAIIFGIALLSLFGGIVKHVVKGGNALDGLTGPFQAFIDFPETAKAALNQVFGDPEVFMEVDPNFSPINKLSYDLYALNSHFEQKDFLWSIQLFNLKDNEILHEWKLSPKHFFLTDRQFVNSEPRNCILLENNALIAACDESQNLYRLDANSEIVWHNTDKKYHHSLNPGPDGNIWICSSDKVYTSNPIDPFVSAYTDNFITKVDVQTGKILFDKSVSKILIENGYINFVHGFGNEIISHGEDPLHLNEIEPVFTSGPYWEKGDLFLSLRHRSLIIQYRPSTNKIIRLLFGPFLNQHDIDIVSDHKIAIFNNNISNAITAANALPKLDELNQNATLKNSEILVYNFQDSTYNSLFPDQFEAEEIFTHTQGFYTILNNGDVFVESQNQGKIFILNEKEVVLKQYINPIINGMVERPHWTRIYEQLKR